MSDKKDISQIIDTSFDKAFTLWSTQIERELYPAAFADEHSWLRVKNSIQLNNQLLKEALKLSLSEILKDN
ncbi:hypothetical protein [uncultured Eubacterium sp.]|uniref:hypothetical protein n=1 Tax=uncultured Eubacterium sp. TaxID=165185 RepID=UPI0026716951|nr:hypothetical protein [uncultured Eubacterium sp.]